MAGGDVHTRVGRLADHVGPRRPAVVLGFDRTDLLGPHDVDQAGGLEHGHVMADRPLGFAQRLGQLLDVGGALEEEVDDLLTCRLEECAVLGDRLQLEHVVQVVVRCPMVGHSRMVGISRPFVKELPNLLGTVFRPCSIRKESGGG